MRIAKQSLVGMCISMREVNLQTLKVTEPLLDKLLHATTEELASTRNEALVDSDINHET